MVKKWIVVTALFGCGGGDNTPDAMTATDAASDAFMPPQFDCATSPSGGTHKLFLNFDGASLTSGSMSNATTDTVAFFDPSKSSTTVPAWKSSAGDRAAQIASVVCNVRKVLFAADVEVVTTRPASGDYEMVVFGGEPSTFGYSFGGSTAMLGTTNTDCMNTNRKDVAWVAEYPSNGNTTFSLSALDSAIQAAAFIGAYNSLNASTHKDNCMCNITGSGVACEISKMCSFTSAAPVASPNECNASGSEDQIAKLTARYGARQF